MWQTIELPIWLFVLIVVFAAVTFASHFLLPSVRWFVRKRLERAVERLNRRLTVPIQPFKLARRTDMIQRLVYDPEVATAIIEHSKREGVREDVAFEKARRYAREIVPSFSAFAYFGLGARLARWLAMALYDVRTGPLNDQHINSIAEKKTVVFVINHRSNMDYVLVTYLAANTSALSFAVGEWAQVWPLSRLIRSMGAYFIRRKTNNRLYQTVLARYVALVTKGGVTQAMFPEGRLSLDGCIGAPKLGLLSYVVQASKESEGDVVFVPVSIAYDRVLEDRVLIEADANGTGRFPAKISVIIKFILQKLWLRLRGRFLPFGVAGVVFGEPVNLSHFGTEPDVNEIGQHLMHSIKRDTPVLGVPFVSRTLITEGGRVKHTRLLEAFEAFDTNNDRLLMMSDLEATLKQMETRGMIRRDGDAWHGNPDASQLLTFYANTIF